MFISWINFYVCYERSQLGLQLESMKYNMKRCFAGINPWCGLIPQKQLKKDGSSSIFFTYRVMNPLPRLYFSQSQVFLLFDFDSCTLLLLTIKIKYRNKKKKRRM